MCVRGVAKSAFFRKFDFKLEGTDNTYTSPFFICSFSVLRILA